MKKTILASAIALLVAGAATAACNAGHCGHDKSIKYAEVAAPAKQFMSKHFGGAKINHVTFDAKDRVPDYDIYLMDGTKIEIDQAGNWDEVSNAKGTVPASLLPAVAVTYLNQNYPGAGITKIEKDRKGYDVKLSNGLELEFAIDGTFLRIDR